MTATPDRTESVFAAAVALATAAERAAYLDQVCADDAALRDRVEALLRVHERAGHLLDGPVPGGPEQTGAYFPSEQAGACAARVPHDPREEAARGLDDVKCVPRQSMATSTMFSRLTES